MPVLNPAFACNRFFEELCKIPHGSYNESAVADWLVSFAKQRGLSYDRDDLHNVIIRKPASAGYEAHPPVMLQAHTDMVCEKNADCTHDFSKDPLQLFIEDGWLKARGTTLGADDGQGVSWMLAILDDASLRHPPLECVFTVQEEVGLCGALHLDAAKIVSRRMINLDGGGECTTDVSSSGGMRVRVAFDGTQEQTALPCYRLFLSGLRGGHSGALIHKGLGSANHIFFRILYALVRQGMDVRLASLSGGLKENAIARECECIFASATPIAALEQAVEETCHAVATELGPADAGMKAALSLAPQLQSALDAPSSQRLIRLGFLLPNGLQCMSPNIPDLPIVSLNLGRVTLEGGHAGFLFSVRSPMDSARKELYERIAGIAELLGASAAISNDYPGWAYEKDSPIREALRAVLHRHGLELEEIATHGGLETGVFKGKIPQMDIVTFGPISENGHTPEERLNIASFERCYTWLTELLSGL